MKMKNLQVNTNRIESVGQESIDLTEVFNTQKLPKDQFKSDATIWEHTLFPKVNPGTKKVEEIANANRLKEQQDILKRHFLAMAILGVVATNSTKSKSVDETTVPKIPVDEIPLAAFASHGGRFAYEANDAKCGQKFNNWLFNGNVDAQCNYDNLLKLPKFKKRGGTESYAALYKRISTHDQKYENKKWIEYSVSLKWSGVLPTLGKPCIGMNIALGGVGNTLKDLIKRDTCIGYEGWAKANQRGTDKYTDYQLGVALFVYKEAKKQEGGKTSRLMVGFEGTAPNAKNQLGAEHGVRSTLKTMIGLAANEVSLTGQEKAKKIGLPHGMGPLKSGPLNEDSLKRLENIYQNFLSELDEQKNRDFFKELLNGKKKEREKTLKIFERTSV